MRFKKLFFWWGPVGFWALIIFLFSCLPTVSTSEIIWWDFLIKKTAHIIEYGVFYFLVLRALNKLEIKFSLKPFKFKIFGSLKKIFVFASFFACFLYALSDEYHQGFTPGRHPALRDIGFDSIGMVLSYLAIKKFLKGRHGKR
jgi:hypothetical protein